MSLWSDSTDKKGRLRYEEAAKAREQKQKADDLKQELAWSHVATKEEELMQKIKEGAKLGRRLPKIEENIQEAQVCGSRVSNMKVN